MEQEASNKKNLLNSWAKIVPKKAPTRNQRFRAALARNHSKIKEGGEASSRKKYKNLKLRAVDIQVDADRLELLNWIGELQRSLGFSDKEFADALEVSIRTVRNYRWKVGYLPSKKTFRKLLELEKLTRHSVIIKKNKTLMVQQKPTHVIRIR